MDARFIAESEDGALKCPFALLPDIWRNRDFLDTVSPFPCEQVFKAPISRISPIVVRTPLRSLAVGPSALLSYPSLPKERAK